MLEADIRQTGTAQLLVGKRNLHNEISSWPVWGTRLYRLPSHGGPAYSSWFRPNVCWRILVHLYLVQNDVTRNFHRGNPGDIGHINESEISFHTEEISSMKTYLQLAYHVTRIPLREYPCDIIPSTRSMDEPKLPTSTGTILFFHLLIYPSQSPHTPLSRRVYRLSYPTL